MGTDPDAKQHQQQQGPGQGSHGTYNRKPEVLTKPTRKTGTHYAGAVKQGVIFFFAPNTIHYVFWEIHQATK